MNWQVLEFESILYMNDFHGHSFPLPSFSLLHLPSTLCIVQGITCISNYSILSVYLLDCFYDRFRLLASQYHIISHHSDIEDKKS